MSLDIRAVQAALRADGLDGWLLYDFRGSNPLAQHLAGLDGGGHLATRRWFYLIPAQGEPKALVHKIEPRTLAHLPGAATRYAGRVELEAGLGSLLSGLRRVAMEYSPKCAIPYVSRVDAGTVELVRGHGVEVVTSADLIQTLRGGVERSGVPFAPRSGGAAVPGEGSGLRRDRPAHAQMARPRPSTRSSR